MGGEVGPQFLHMFFEMDNSGFRVLTSSESISSEIEFPCPEASGLLEEVLAAEGRSLACQGKRLASCCTGISRVHLP